MERVKLQKITIYMMWKIVKKPIKEVLEDY